jgi:uncharacterized protein (TIGR02145 family)
MKNLFSIVGAVLLIILINSCKKDTPTRISVPVLTTTEITSITQTTAVTGGNISTDNGGSVTARGVCWGTVTNPTMADSKTTDGTDKGSFVSNLTGLLGNTTYYVRSYATNSGGTGYGNLISFTTPGDKPAVTRPSVIKLGVKTASLSCYVNPNFMNTTVVFEWGTTTSYGNSAEASQNSLTGGNLVNASTNLTGLQSEITYNFRIKATNSLGTIYSDNKSFKTYAAVDSDGYGYYSITIGTQTWLTENLKTTLYNDGTAIPNVTDSIAWEALTTGAYCNYRNRTDSALIATHGRLYNWYAVNTGKLAIKGWHIPTHDEWKTLVDFLGGENVAGGKLKETGTIHWLAPNSGATNESGFTALPSGYRGKILYYVYQSFGMNVAFWESTIYTSTQAYGLVLRYNETTSQTYIFNKAMGFPVRLIKD